MPFDLLLRGGTVIDGSGGPSRRADVAIEGDRVAAIGLLEPAAARRTIDVHGLAVAPGFVDTHNHCEGWLLKQSHFWPSTSQGFTTQVLMSDGISYAPLTPATAADWLIYLRSLDGLQLRDYSGWRTIDDYLSRIDRRNVQNVISEIPYANVRVLACGWGRTAPDDTQIKRMRREVRRAMDDGAVGLSTGLDYIVQCFASTDELVEVCAAMSPYGGLYVTHMRYKKGLMPALREAVEIARRAAVPLHVSHLKPLVPVQVEELLEYIDRVAASEVDFSFDVYPYMPGSTALNSLLPYEAWEDGPLGVAARLREPAIRERFAELLADYQLPLEEIKLAWVAGKANSEYQGLSLGEYVRRSGRAAAEALIELLIEEQLAALAVFHVGDDRLVEPMLAHPRMMIGSDGIYQPEGAIHPRAYGSAPRMLGPMVRDRRLFSLEAAVRKLSGYPAERFGLKERGLVREGYFADLVLFDPATVTDRATYDQPHEPAAGIEHVLVNGTPIIAAGQPVELPGPELPGRALKFHRA